MANEITISASIRYSKAKASAGLATTYNADQTGDKYEAGVQTVGTSEENLVKGDVGTIGWVALRNMDATNFVEFGAATGELPVKLLAGKGTVIPWNATVCIAKANTGACLVEYLLIEV